MTPHYDGRDNSLLYPRSVQQEEHGLWNQWMWIQAAHLPAISYVTFSKNSNSWSLHFLRWEQKITHTGCVWEHYPKEYVRRALHDKFHIMGISLGQLSSPSALYGVVILNPHSKE